MSDWIKHAIWWHIYPIGFVGAEPTAQSRPGITHRLDQIIRWLDYVIELGASGLILGPIFESASHGYDTIDHFRIDPRLGDNADFDALLAAAGRRGLRVILDGVFNHVGRDFPAFREVLAQGPQAPHASWFRLTWPSGHSSGQEPDYATFEGHRRLVAVNHAEPAVRDYVTHVMTHWLDRGADGWRLDAAYAVPPAFWGDILPRVRARHPAAWFVGEVIHGDYAAFVQDSGVDSVTQYELWKAIWSTLNDRNFFELAWALDRHDRLLESFVPLTFIGNHDVTRLASRLTDERHIPHALVILLMCGGTPSIYAGDEQAFRGIKEDRAGGDDAIRPAFPATPDGLAPFGWPIYRLHQTLIGLRRRNPWLHRACTQIVHLNNAQMAFESRREDQCLLVALNLDDTTQILPAPGMHSVIAGDGTLTHAGSAGARISLSPHGWAILAPGA
jgi:cyclomaltodextrinase / maltogenic alpha-amylase / neopullulanase